MTSLLEDICQGLVAGEFRERRLAYALRWREYRNQYCLDHVIKYATRDKLSTVLYDTLEDVEFRHLRASVSGINALRDDLHRGLDFFGKQLDLSRYVSILFLESHADSSGASGRAHQQHLQGFSDFLQLDVPPAGRVDMGIQRVLAKFLPKLAGFSSDDDKRDVLAESDKANRTISIRFMEYELGIWRCECGALTGQTRRYDYRCPCGLVDGNGRLAEDAPACARCGGRSSYIPCSTCKTRVTLELFWNLAGGNVHPSAYRVPLEVRYAVITEAGETEQSIVLLHLPLMLGIREVNDHIAFGPPDLFWINDTGAPSADQDVQLLGLPDSIRYDKHGMLRKALEASLRRTLRQRTLARSLRRALRYPERPTIRRYADLMHSLTHAFERRLESIATSTHGGDLVKLVDLSRDCVVAASSRLRHNMAWVNRETIRRGGFVVPSLVHLTVLLRRSAVGNDVLTAKPSGRDSISTLDDDGIVFAGREVYPGDVLVGIESPEEQDLTAQERLLRALFGERIQVDRSLLYTGTAPGRVLAVRVALSKAWSGPELQERPGRFISRHNDLGATTLARIGVTLAVDRPLEVGDTLSHQGDVAIVCCIATGEALAQTFDLSVEPDLVVATGHCWAPQTMESHTRIVRIGISGDSSTEPSVSCRRVDYYSFGDQRPLFDPRSHDAGQLLNFDHFQWLTNMGTHSIALELYGARGDCPSWRDKLYQGVFDRERSLSMLQPTTIEAWNTINDAPSQGMRNLGWLLRAAGINCRIADGEIAFEPLSNSSLLSISHGEVTKRLTIARTRYAEPDGLLCERIFGAQKRVSCRCGKYRREKHLGMTCERCGVLVADGPDRYERMGHIQLAIPVAHVWYFRRTGILTDAIGMSTRDLEKLIYYEQYLVIDPGESGLQRGFRFDKADAAEVLALHLDDGLRLDSGAVAIQFLLQARQDRLHCNDDLSSASILWYLPVLPVRLRPMFRVTRGFHIDDLNNLYSRVIVRNHRVKRLLELQTVGDPGGALGGDPQNMINVLGEAKRELQDAVDALLDNDQGRPSLKDPNHRPLKSITHKLHALTRGRGSLRNGFLSRPADFSASARLAVGEVPEIDCCALPHRIAWEIYQPRVLSELIASNVAGTIEKARRLFAKQPEVVRPVLERVCAAALVLVAPAFGAWPLVALRPRLGDHNAIVVRSDLLDHLGWSNLGKRMQLFGILTEEAEREARDCLLPSQLQARPPGSERQPTSSSAFDVGGDRLVEELVKRTLGRRSFQLDRLDHLLLCSSNALIKDPE